MSHDVKKNKLLKKIIGLFGYKIVDKNSAKTERLLESLSFSSGDFIKFLINTKKINEIIQIGANDGKSDDFLRESINKDTKVLLVEPIESAFIELKKNYSGYNNVKFINKALDVNRGKKSIYTVNPEHYDYYKKKYKSNNVDWLTVLASFEESHLINHGVKLKHIHSTDVDCMTFNDLIKQYNFNQLDLLIIDTEGYDSILVKNFIEDTNIRPIIIFEWIHMKKDEAKNIIELLEANNYKFLKINKDLICIQNSLLFN
jgi:FkbM family methyltransferase